MEYPFIDNNSIAHPLIKILVVDDKEENLFSMQAVLERDGHIITKASSGREALKILLKEIDFSLILMDVQMPELNGFETANLIYQREKLSHIPIIFITANDHREESVFRGYKMGGVDYLYKPINPDLLRAKVGVFVDLYQKKYQLIAQEQKLITINKKLEKEIEERKISEERVSLLNQQLIENIARLKASNEELEQFAYIASHDLQEPLRKIILFGDRLGQKYKSELGADAHTYLEKMMNATRRMQLLIKNILAFSRTSNNLSSFEYTDINALVNNVISDLEVYIEQKKAIINVINLPYLWVVPDQIRQVFQNIIINALKFSKNDIHPIVNIYGGFIKGIDIPGADAGKYSKEYYGINIADNGIGFDSKYVDDIFKIFKRLHSNDEFEGTGIGLSIVKKIIERHNGYISVTSEEGKGSVFTIALPVDSNEQI